MQFKIAQKLAKKKIPLILEKPLTTNIIDKNILEDKFRKYKTLVYVNHFHFFHLEFRKIISDISNKKISQIRIYDGDSGPFRKSFSSLWDWGSHGLGIYSYFFPEIPEKIEVNQINKISIGEIWEIEFFIKNKQIFKLICGNAFKEKRREIIIDFEGNNQSINFDIANYKNLKKFPMELMLEEFYNDIIDRKKSNMTLDIATKTIELTNLIELTLKKDEHKYKSH